MFIRMSTLIRDFRVRIKGGGTWCSGCEFGTQYFNTVFGSTYLFLAFGRQGLIMDSSLFSLVY